MIRLVDNRTTRATDARRACWRKSSASIGATCPPEQVRDYLRKIEIARQKPSQADEQSEGQKSVS